MYTDVVFDVESLSHPTAAQGRVIELTQVAAVAWNRHDPTIPDYELNVFPEEGNGYTDPNTVLWWMKQMEERGFPNWYYVRKHKETLLMAGVLNEIRAFMATVMMGPKKWDGSVWGNDPEMDLTPLEHHFAAHKIPCPWFYYNRDNYRTLRKLVGARGSNGGHDALEDARHEKDRIQEWLERLSIDSKPLVQVAL